MGRLNEGSGGGHGPFSGMVLGETRTWITKDGREIKLTRSGRAFVYDLCYAYNDSMPKHIRDNGKQWFVDAIGGLQLGDKLKRSNLNAVAA